MNEGRQSNDEKYCTSPHPSAIFLVVHERIPCSNRFIVFPPFGFCDVIDVQVDYQLYGDLMLSISTVKPQQGLKKLRLV